MKCGFWLIPDPLQSSWRIAIKFKINQTKDVGSVADTSAKGQT